MNQESTRFIQSTALPGVELLNVENYPRPGPVFNMTYAVVLLYNWSGSLRYRQRTQPLAKGNVVYTTPGELHISFPLASTNGYRALLIEPAVLELLARERGMASRPEWRCTTTRPSPLYAHSLAACFEGFTSDITVLEHQTRFLTAMDHALGDFVEPMRDPISSRSVIDHQVARVRERLHASLDGAVPLDDLARDTTMSRFQLLRAFKRQYGLPPHGYQLCVRMSHARQLLARGHSAASVAAKLNFVDQNHLRRHFVRVFGLTPGQQLREYRPSRAGANPMHHEGLSRDMVHRILSRSDAGDR